MAQKQDEFFQLKADLVPLTVLKITNPSIEGIAQQLNMTVEKAPNYFHQAPMLIDLSGLESQKTLNFAELMSTLKAMKLVPVAVRGLTDDNEAKEHNLAILKKSSEKEKAPQKTNASAKAGKPFSTKIITKPVRAGTQVYAKNSDLIILSGVNPGAECFADGSIHVYGPLRGRALAGVNGDTNARIFCKSLEAELIAIAGHYQVKEDIKVPSSNTGIVQVYLNNEKLTINTI